MKEIPIIFSTPMVMAILENRKTMTRRVFKRVMKQYVGYRNKVAGLMDTSLKPLTEKEFYEVNSPIQKGNILWVRETWRVSHVGLAGDEEWAHIVYKCGKNKDIVINNSRDRVYYASKARWQPSIHMPHEAARIFLEVVSMRVERLHELTETDAKAEGFLPMNPLDLKQLPMTLIEPGGQFGKGQIRYSSYRASFYEFWETKNERRGFPWDTNPWVWVIEFKRIKI